MFNTPAGFRICSLPVVIDGVAPVDEWQAGDLNMDITFCVTLSEGLTLDMILNLASARD